MNNQYWWTLQAKSTLGQKANENSYWDNIGKQNKMTKSKTKNFLHDTYFLKYMYIYHLCHDKRKLKLFTKATPSVSRGGYFWEFLVGVCHSVLQILTLFQTKNCHFSHLFSNETSKVHTCFQTWPLGKNYVLITNVRAQTKRFFKSI